MGAHVISFSSDDSLATGAARWIAATLAGIPGDRVNLGLAGGSTPAATYQRLRDEEVGWDRADLWLSDERWVPWDHADSNGRMVADALADHIPARFHRPRFSPHLEPADSAAFYEAELRRLLTDGAADLILLGMGADGHTASLFPGSEALVDQRRWFVHNRVPQQQATRLTATSRLLTAARRVAVLVAGVDKSETLAAVLEGPDGMFPIQFLQQAAGEVTWLTDREAASRLSSTEVDQG